MKTVLQKTFSAIFATIFLALSISATASGQNLLINGSFEAGTSGWVPFATDASGAVSIDNSESFEGSASARIDIVNPGLSVVGAFAQEIPVQAGKHYLLSYAVKTQTQSALVLPYVLFKNDVDSQVFSESIFPSFGVTGWESHASRFIAPTGSAKFTIMLVAIADSGSSPTTAWFDAVLLSEVTDTASHDIRVNLGSDDGLIVPDLSTNVGPLRTGNPLDLTADFRRIGFRFVRTHDYHTACDISLVFPDTTADPLDPASYNFASTDTAISAIIASGAEVFFRLGEGYGPADTNLPANTPPPDPDKWAQVALHIVKHYNGGWNNGFVYNIRYWEIWNEPDLIDFWNGSAGEFAHLYARTAQLLKSHDPSLQIGGPAVASVANSVFLGHLFDTLAATGAPLDFFSYHNYVSSNPANFCRVDSIVNVMLRSHGYDGLPTFITEWNTFSFDPDHWSNWGRDDALNAASTESALIYMRRAGITGAMRYRVDEHFFGLFRYDGNETYAGLAFEVFSGLRRTPYSVATSGGDELGTTLIAGSNDNQSRITAIISDNSSNANGYRLHLDGLGQIPKQRALSRASAPVLVYHYEVTRIDSTHESTLAVSGDVSSDNPIISVAARSPFVDKVTLQLTDTILTKKSTTVRPLVLDVYPNPFNPATTITFEIQKEERVQLQVYNILGQRVRTLLDERLSGGEHRVSWNAESVGSGVYFVRFSAGNTSVTRRVVLLK